MQRTLKREFKELEIVKRETIEVSYSTALGEIQPAHGGLPGGEPREGECWLVRRGGSGGRGVKPSLSASASPCWPSRPPSLLCPPGFELLAWRVLFSLGVSQHQSSPDPPALVVAAVERAVENQRVTK